MEGAADARATFRRKRGRRRGPVRRSGGFVGGLIFLAILGLGAAGWNDWWGPMRANWGDNNDNFFNFFGQPEHDQEQELLNVQVPANALVQIENPRGDVSVTTGDGNNVQVQAHMVAYSSSDAEAKKIFDAAQAHVKVSGNTVLVIEHNMDVIKVADHIIDLGPEGGDGGGKILFEGTPEELVKNKESHTARFLKEEL